MTDNEIDLERVWTHLTEQAEKINEICVKLNALQARLNKVVKLIDSLSKKETYES